MVNPELEDVKDPEEFLDAEIFISEETLSVNISMMPLVGQKSAWNYAHDRGYQFGKKDEITMSRYMDPGFWINLWRETK